MIFSIKHLFILLVVNFLLLNLSGTTQTISNSKAVYQLESHAKSPVSRLQSSIGDSLHVLHYDIHIDTLNFATSSLKAHTEISLQSLVNNLQLIQLSLDQLVVDSIKSSNGNLSFLQNTPILSIQLMEVLNQGDSASFTIYYHGNPPEDPSGWGGFTFSGNYAFNMGVGFEVNPHVYGRAWFPCLDIFTDKSYYDFHIKTTGSNQAHCNGKLIGIDSLEDGSRIFNWHLDQPIPSYLAGMAVGNYTTYYDTSLGIPVEIAAVGNDGPNILNSMAKLDTAVTIFQKFYGPYPWNKIGYTTVPFNAGAMEHATNIHIGRLFMNGSLDYETLWAHELSHMWWGDLVTCSSQEDMWLNEGFASFNEQLFTEAAYGKNAYKNSVRQKHRNVLQFCHITDGSYLALNAIPFQFTYSSTVYDKGSDIAHTLRGYLGDSLFKIGCQNYMNSLSFRNASSFDFRDKLIEGTGIDLNSFFDGWVFTPGFPHFSLDSFRTSPSSLNAWNVEIYTSQKGLGNSHIYSMPVKISFYDALEVYQVQTFLIDSQFNHFSVEVPIPPTMLAIDREEEMSDAVVDYEQKIKSSGTFIFPETNFTLLNQQALGDSVLVRIEHHFVAPDTLILPNGISKISDYHYWHIDGSWDNSFSGKGKFIYDGSTSNTSGYQDNSLFTGNENYIRLLYRPNRGSNWQIAEGFILNKGSSVNDKRGNIEIDSLRKGEYCFGWSETPLSIKQDSATETSISLFPNPASNELEIDFKKVRTENTWTILILDSQGKELQKTYLVKGQNSAKVNVYDLKSGIYVVAAKELGGNREWSEVFIKD